MGTRRNYAPPNGTEIEARLAVLFDRVQQLAQEVPSAAAAGVPGAYVLPGDLDHLSRHQPPFKVTTTPTGRLGRLLVAFGLDAVDVELLLVAAAPEIDQRFEALFGYLQNDLTRRRPGAALALRLAGASSHDLDGRRRLCRGSPLVDGGLVRLEELSRPFPSRPVVVPDRVVRWLLGEDDIDHELAAVTSVAVPDDTGADSAVAALERGVHLVYLRAGPASDPRAVAMGAAARLGVAVLPVDLTWADPGLDLTELAGRLLREARLHGAILTVGPIECLVTDGRPALRILAESDWPMVLYGSSHWDPSWVRRVPFVLPVEAASPERKGKLWADALATTALDPAVAVGDMSALRLTSEQVSAAVESATLTAQAQQRPMTVTDLLAGARAQNSGGLERLARRIEPRATFTDLIVPDTVSLLLRELISRSRHIDLVVHDWQLGATGHGSDGVSALFDGPSGTGKTLGAEVLAGALGVDLYVVDLSTVVDKYIGETEKKLDRIFTEAESVNGVLLFDEADALFGRRSEVKDSHDRYANIEVAYLLQRIEAFGGTVVLTSNLRQNIDDAFLRRLDAIVSFPAPAHAARLQLWRRFLAGVPLDADVDLEFCAAQFELTGGEIRNIALAAAFAGADIGPPVTCQMIVRAIEREYRKLGRLIHPSEFGRYAELLAETPTR